MMMRKKRCLHCLIRELILPICNARNLRCHQCLGLEKLEPAFALGEKTCLSFSVHEKSNNHGHVMIEILIAKTLLICRIRRCSSWLSFHFADVVWLGDYTSHVSLLVLVSNCINCLCRSDCLQHHHRTGYTVDRLCFKYTR